MGFWVEWFGNTKDNRERDERDEEKWKKIEERKQQGRR